MKSTGKRFGDKKGESKIQHTHIRTHVEVKHRVLAIYTYIYIFLFVCLSYIHACYIMYVSVCGYRGCNVF